MRKFIIFFLGIVCLFFLILTGCDKKNPTEQADYITLSKTELEFDSNGGYQTINISSSGNWEATGENDWCQIAPVDNSTETIQIITTNNVEKENRTTTITFTCGKASVQLTVVQYGVIESDYIDLKLDKEGITSVYNESSGELTINYGDNEVPDISTGKAIVLPGEYQYDIRVIESISSSDKKVVLQTKEGNMCDLFRNINFTLTTNPDLVSATRSTGRVITPSSIELVDKDKRYTIYKRSSTMTRDSFTGGYNFFSMSKNFDGQTLCGGKWGSLQWEKCNYDSKLDAVFFFDFGEKTLLEAKKGDLKTFQFYLDGNINIELLLAYISQTSYSEEIQEIIKENILPTVEINFPVGNIPVRVTLDTHLGQRFTLDCEANIKADAGIGLHANARIGMQYNKGDNYITPFSSFKTDYQVYDPTFNIQGSAQVTASFYPELEIKLYKFLGPWVDLIPYIGDRLEAGAQFSVAGNNYKSWTAEIISGIDAQMGLQLDWFNFSAELIDPVSISGKECILYKAPEEIELQSPQNGSPVTVGEEVEVTFQAFAKNHLTDERCNVNGAIIVLETEGEVENEIVKTDENGYVTVKWKAKSQQDKLIAKLVDKAGETINQAEFAPAIQNNISINIKDTQGQLGGHATFVLETRADLPDNVQLSNTGIYVLKDDGTYSLIPAAMKQGNSFISTFMLEENAKDMTVDYQNFTASKEIQIGTFTQKEENGVNKIYYSSPQTVKLEYNQKPNVTFTNINTVATESLEDGYIKQTFDIFFNIQGAFFMKTFYWESPTGNSSPYDNVTDGVMDVILPLIYYPDNPGYDKIRYHVVTGNNKTIYSDNCVYWQNGSLFIGQ